MRRGPGKCQIDAASGGAAASGGHVGLASSRPSGLRWWVVERLRRSGSSSTVQPSYIPRIASGESARLPPRMTCTPPGRLRRWRSAISADRT